MAKRSKLEVALVMVPLPAQGHLNQLLHLSASSPPITSQSTSPELPSTSAKLKIVSKAGTKL
ncbi:hypothetical protein HAX54_009664, partial [Datura stramonium]|nr:hypothetical protein [Datura stramonium]